MTTNLAFVDLGVHEVSADHGHKASDCRVSVGLVIKWLSPVAVRLKGRMILGGNSS